MICLVRGGLVILYTHGNQWWKKAAQFIQQKGRNSVKGLNFSISQKVLSPKLRDLEKGKQNTNKRFHFAGFLDHYFRWQGPKALYRRYHNPQVVFGVLFLSETFRFGYLCEGLFVTEARCHEPGWNPQSHKTSGRYQWTKTCRQEVRAIAFASWSCHSLCYLKSKW